MFILSIIATCKAPKRKPDKRKQAYAIACFGLILGTFFFSVCYVGISSLEFEGIVQPQLEGCIVLGHVVARKMMRRNLDVEQERERNLVGQEKLV